jgi:hypothetical protein
MIAIRALSEADSRSYRQKTRRSPTSLWNPLEASKSSWASSWSIHLPLT